VNEGLLQLNQGAAWNAGAFKIEMLLMVRSKRILDLCWSRRNMPYVYLGRHTYYFYSKLVNHHGGSCGFVLSGIFCFGGAKMLN